MQAKHFHEATHFCNGQQCTSNATRHLPMATQGAGGLRRYGPKDPRSPTDPKVEPQDVRPEACSTYVCVQYNRQQCKPSTFMKQLIFAMDSNATQALAMQQDICAWSPKEPEACVGTVQKTHAHRRTRK